MSSLSDISCSDDESPQLRVDGLIGHCISRCPRFRTQSGSFIPPRSFVCTNGTRLYIGVFEEAVRGGQRRRGVAQRELLCLELLPNNDLDFFPSEKFGRDHWVPVRLHWLSKNGTLRRARVRRRGDEMESLTFTAYRTDGVRIEPLLHRILAFTFRCPLRFWSLFFSPTQTARMDGYDVMNADQTLLYDVHHVNECHGDNALENLEIMLRDGPAGHRSLSASSARRR